MLTTQDLKQIRDIVKEATLEVLEPFAIAIQQDLHRLDERMSALEERVSYLGSRMDSHERRMEALENILTRHQKELSAIQKTLVRIEQKQKDKADVKIVQKLDRRIALLEKRVNKLDQKFA